MGKRILGYLVAATLIMSLVVGCGSKAVENGAGSDKQADDGEFPSGNVTLRVWGAEEDGELINQIISGFTSEYAGQATFNITFEAHSEANCKDDILGDVLNAPDVFTFADDQLMAFVASGVLKKVQNDSDISVRNLKAAVDAASVGGSLYAYPLTADNGYFLFYNSKELSEEDVQTMDSLLDAAGKKGKKVFMDMNSGWYMYSFFGNTDMEIGLNDDGISTYCNWNAKYTDITGKDVAEAMLKIAANPAFTAVSDEGFAAGAARGEFVAGVSGIWDENAIKEAWGDDYEAVKLPTYTVAGQQLQMASYAGYKLVGVNSYSENAAWAAKFADWMTNEKNQTLRFNMRGQGPSNKNASASGDVAQSKSIKALQQQAEFSNLQRVGGTYWDAAAAFGKEVSEGNPSGKDLQVLLNEMVKGITGEETTGDAPGNDLEEVVEESLVEESITEKESAEETDTVEEKTDTEETDKKEIDGEETDTEETDKEELGTDETVVDEVVSEEGAGDVEKIGEVEKTEEEITTEGHKKSTEEVGKDIEESTDEEMNKETADEEMNKETAGEEMDKSVGKEKADEPVDKKTEEKAADKTGKDDKGVEGKDSDKDVKDTSDKESAKEAKEDAKKSGVKDVNGKATDAGKGKDKATETKDANDKASDAGKEKDKATATKDATGKTSTGEKINGKASEVEKATNKETKKEINKETNKATNKETQGESSKNKNSKNGKAKISGKAAGVYKKTKASGASTGVTIESDGEGGKEDGTGEESSDFDGCLELGKANWK
ncbi:extracellular solute-binding protein [Butyrivibrio sp. AC2005]|uniref:extracellular solute-binding protein n=1 Tax=Butyrivibrio sp. AC2005 TaxID=1280672 RepID=UPI0003FFEA9E|nr:extracellular solute-binding protein [Butyrivibrio sp. AC2005]